MAVAALDIPREDMKHVDAVASMVCYSVVGRCRLIALQISVYKLLVLSVFIYTRRVRIF